MLEQQLKVLNVSNAIVKNLKRKGFEKLNPIQKMVIPFLMEKGENLIAKAQTGTGKTAAFGIPLIETLQSKGKIQSLILTPTRELCVQVAEELYSISKGKNLKILPVYGGQSINFQISRIRNGQDIIVGTPGRILDLLDRKILNFSFIKYLILDEADKMLDMGFIDDIEKIMRYTNRSKKILLFSATIPSKLLKLAKKYMNDYKFFEVKNKNITADTIKQVYYDVYVKDKIKVICNIIDSEPQFYGLIFCNTKAEVNDLYGKLHFHKYKVKMLHGDLSQKQREITLKNFKDKKTRILVATDVAARGLDIMDLTHVINYSLPQNLESYVHRIGRTGRAGKNGTAITLVTPSEKRRFFYMQKIFKLKIKKETLVSREEIQIKKLAYIKSKIHNQKNIPFYIKDFTEDLISENSDTKELIEKILNYFLNN